MARKKKNNNNQTTSAAPNKEQAQKQSQEESRVIDELFGNLDEPDIESDIAELGGSESDQAVSGKQPRSRFYFVFAVVVIVMAVIGVISSVRFVAQITSNLLDNTSLKNEFARFIYPVVVNDIAPFEEPDEIPDSSKISCAIWNILLNRDTSEFAKDEGNGLTIPEYNVLASCRELFGSTVSLNHQTVGNAEVRFTYNEETHTYSANKNIRYLTYSPQIISMTEDGDVYTVIVGYVPPTLAAVAGTGRNKRAPGEVYGVHHQPLGRQGYADVREIQRLHTADRGGRRRNVMNHLKFFQLCGIMINGF